MTTLAEILTDLSSGEFSQLSLGNFDPQEHTNEPDPKSYQQLNSWLMLALNAIYSEFWLASEEVTIQLNEAIGTYTLSYDYAFTNTGGSQPIKYIIDSVATPFTDNVLKIESIYDEEGNELPLNDPYHVDSNGEPDSYYTPTYRNIQVPWPNTNNAILVQFRAGHPKLTYTYGVDPATIEILIPHQLREALLFYVASRGFKAMGQSAEAGEYMSMYANKVLEVKTQGLYIQTEPSNDRFENNGWC